MIEAEMKSGATAKTTGPSPVETVKQSQPEVPIDRPADVLPLSVMGEPMVHRAQWDSSICACLGRNNDFCSSDLEGFPVLGSNSAKWSSFGKLCEDPIRNNVGCVGIDGNTSNCSTVGKLYAWGKILYQEVKLLEFQDFEVRA
ncbi:uncharacterized protein Fot_47961 [Forsythia ovata]|uniref:Uncharacterized protein n=1 Tax=Forsythia ovata TaxID=205694 RepID=A0ABD1QRW3_9LAMI